MAAEAAPSAFVVQTRTADGCCGLATFAHHSAARGQRTARAREGGSETKNTAEDRRTPPPEEPSTQYYGLDEDDSVPELSGGRPDPVLDPGPPQAGLGRHTGEAFELVLDPVVPQLGRDVTEEPDGMVHQFIAAWELVARESGLGASYMQEEVFGRRRREREAAEHAEASESRSSNKMGGRRKRKKRRKKLPKTSSSTSSRRRGVDKEIMHEHAGDLNVHVYTLHAEPLNSIHSNEITGYMDKIIKLIEEKVIAGNTGEEIILKNGSSARYLYGDRTHVYKWRWLDWEKKIIDTFTAIGVRTRADRYAAFIFIQP